MVLIFNPENNFTNYKLFDFFIANNVSYEVIDPTKIYSLTIKQNNSYNTSIIINQKEIFLKSISCIFSTSSNLNLNVEINDNDFKEFKTEEVFSFLNAEWRKLNEFVIYILKKNTNYLSVPYDDENKLITNDIAKKLGFKIPNSIITSSKNAIKNHFNQLLADRFVVKRINEFLSGKNKNDEYFQHESLIMDINELDNFKENLLPTLSQEYISFEYEVRSLYINENIFSVARYSKSYDIDMPFVLDENIKLKVTQLMKNLDLKFGSVDLLIDSLGNYYFLEVNPHGQYDIIEVLGDFEIYKKIYEFIYEKEKSFICNS